jgi:hypothetical protein
VTAEPSVIVPVPVVAVDIFARLYSFAMMDSPLY